MLKENDVVLIHTHELAKRFRGRRFTCLTDERSWGDEMGYVMIHNRFVTGPEGIAFFTDYLKKVDVVLPEKSKSSNIIYLNELYKHNK